MSILRRHSLLTHLALFAALGSPASARADWIPVEAIVGTPVASLIATGDTLLAGANGVMWTSTDAGLDWSAPHVLPVAGRSIQALVRHRGRIFAGSFGFGVFVSDDFGVTWSAFNTGLVGGFLDSQLKVTDLVVRADTLYAATAGAGVYARALTGVSTWSPLGQELEAQQASNLNDLESDGRRLLALGGVNGMVFERDPGATDWTESDLDNIGVHAGLFAQTALFTGSAWIVGSNNGVFRSAAGAEPWTRTPLGLGPVDWSAFALTGHRIYLVSSIPAGAFMLASDDDGLTWREPDFQPGAFVKQLAASRGVLFAARNDGLWTRVDPLLAVAPGAGVQATRLTVDRVQPDRGRTRFRLMSPQPGPAVLVVHDVVGRACGQRLEFTMNAGARSIELDTSGLATGFYLAEVRLAGQRSVARFTVLR